MGFLALLVENRRQGIEQLKVNVRNLLHFGDRKLHMILIEVLKPYGEPNILAINVIKIISLLIRASPITRCDKGVAHQWGLLVAFCNCSHSM
jgi:hypothetical protein